MTFLADFEVRVILPNQIHIRVFHYNCYFQIQQHEARWLVDRESPADPTGRITVRIIVTELNYLVMEGSGITLTWRLTRNHAQALRDLQAGHEARQQAGEIEVAV